MNHTALTLHATRLKEDITLEAFANEMQTSYPRHIVQDFTSEFTVYYRGIYKTERLMWLGYFALFLDKNNL